MHVHVLFAQLGASCNSRLTVAQQTVKVPILRDDGHDAQGLKGWGPLLMELHCMRQHSLHIAECPMFVAAASRGHTAAPCAPEGTGAFRTAAQRNTSCAGSHVARLTSCRHMVSQESSPSQRTKSPRRPRGPVSRCLRSSTVHLRAWAPLTLQSPPCWHWTSSRTHLHEAGTHQLSSTDLSGCQHVIRPQGSASSPVCSPSNLCSLHAV